VISFACPHCGKPFDVPDDHAGQSALCFQCGESIVVPSAVAAEPPAASSPFTGDSSSSPFASEGAASPFAGMGGRPSEELWSSHGRDALFLAVLSCLLLAFGCLLPALGFLLAGAVALVAGIMAIRAMVVAGSRSSKGLAYAIAALVISLVPLGLGFVYLVGMLLSFLR
jgi:hypothetical protein